MVKKSCFECLPLQEVKGRNDATELTFTRRSWFNHLVMKGQLDGLLSPRDPITETENGNGT